MNLSLKEKLAYGVGDTASNLVFMTMLNFLPFFYTDIFGISAAAVGSLFLGVRVMDAFVDVSVGVFADRTHTRWGNFRPWLLWFCVPFAVTAILTFTTPQWSPGAKLAYAWVTYSLLMIAYSAINVPYGALLGVMTSDPHARTSLSGVRMVCAQIGGLIVAGGTLPLINYFSGAQRDRALGYQRTMIVFGIFGMLLFLATFLFTRERIAPPADQQHDLKADVRMLFKNVPWIVVSVAGAVLFIFVSVRLGVVLYYFKYYIGDESKASLFFIISSLAAIPEALLSAPISLRLGKRRTFQLGLLLAGCFFAAVVVVPPDGVWLLQTLNALGSISTFIVAPLIYSMLGDTADYAAWKFRRRSTGIIFSASSLASKVGMGLGGALTGALLTHFGYVANAAQTPEAVRGLVLMSSIFPAIGFFLIAAWMMAYRLDEKTSETMRIELAAAKAPANPVGA